MKKLYICIIIYTAFFSFTAIAQNNVATSNTVKDSVNGDIKVTTVHLDTQILKFFRFPKESEKLKSGRYKINLSFLINEDNSISRLKVKQDPGYGIGNALMEAVLALAKNDSEFIKKLKGDEKELFISAPITLFIQN
ncbi:MAG: hypothetical protein DI539_08585 [Flavobacterium psychrophilum]|nr:MAG: hypothetical protein DI539_08585 [Flavobacterium psychrophilum]